MPTGKKSRKPKFKKVRIRERQRAAPSPDAFAYRLEDAEAMGGPCRSAMYELRKAGDLKFIKVAGRTMVTGESLRRLLGVKEEAAAPIAEAGPNERENA